MGGEMKTPGDKHYQMWASFFGRYPYNRMVITAQISSMLTEAVAS